MWVYVLVWADPGYREMADACECGNEPTGSVKCGVFLNSCKPVSCSRGTLHNGVSIPFITSHSIVYRLSDRPHLRWNSG